MVSVKFILLMFLALPCIFGMTSEQAAVKPDINWGPVWDDLDGNKEFVVGRQDDTMGQAAKNCRAPNGLGLQNLFRQIDRILPKQQIKDIVKTYDEDSQVKAIKAFLGKPQTQEKMKAIGNSAECRKLKDYLCRKLHIELLQYQQLVRILINPAVPRSSAAERKGMRGLLRAIDAVLPHQQIRALHQNLMASDVELAKAFANLRTDEFRKLVLNVRNLPAYKELGKEVNDMGVPLDLMREIVAKTLGWSSQVPLIV